MTKEDWQTHRALVETARRYLARTCSVVATEINTIGEAPDAIGWHSSTSSLIEVKASRSDFLADRNKWFRQRPEQGVGVYRYYLAPKGLIRSDELPDRWGLLEFDGKRVYRTRPPGIFPEHNVQAEQVILLSLLRRIGQTCPKGVSVKAYYSSSSDRTTLTLDVEEIPNDDKPGNVADFAPG